MADVLVHPRSHLERHNCQRLLKCRSGLGERSQEQVVRESAGITDTHRKCWLNGGKTSKTLNLAARMIVGNRPLEGG